MADDSPSMPPEYRKRLIQGVAAWLVLVLALGAWVWLKAPATLGGIEAGTPHATVPVENIYADMDETAAGNGKAGPEDAAAADGSGYVGLIITGLGLLEAETERAVEELPTGVTLAFSPYSRDLEKWLRAARGEGHETLLLLPMEPRNYPTDDPGPKALLSRAPASENTLRLSKLLREAPGVTGVMNFMGSSFLRDKTGLPPVLETLKAQDLVFAEQPSGKDEPGAYAAAAARGAGLPYISTDASIDTQATEQEIRHQLLELERLARKKGYALGVAEPYPVSINTIRVWSDGLEQRGGVKLLPLSALMKVRERHEPSASEE